MLQRMLKYFGYEKAKPLKKRGFAGASTGRLYGSWNPGNLSGNAEVWRDLQTLRARSRDLERNDGYAKKFFRMVGSNVIGPKGIILQSTVLTNNKKPDQVARQRIEAGFKDFCKMGNCDVTGKYSFVDVARLAVTSMARDGEVLIRKVKGHDNKFGFSVQLIEADHLDENHHDELPNGNRIMMGIEFNPWGKPVAYHLYKTHPGEYRHAGRSYGEKERIPADEIIHLFLPWRISQSRGVPWIHAALTRLQMLDGYEEAEVTAARIAASKGGFYTREGDSEYTGDDKVNNQPVQEIEPGTFEILPAGFDFKQYDPTHPTTAFPAFMKAVLRGISSAFDVSYNYLANDLEGVNYSSIRAGVLDERDVWRQIQQYMITHFYTPI